MRCCALILLVFLAPAIPAESSGPAVEAGGTLVLDQSTYWRYCVQFGIDRIAPELLKAEGEKVLSKNGLARLERMVKRWRRPPFAAGSRQEGSAKGDWRDDAPFWVTQVANVGCDDERISFHVHSPPPPAGWMGTGFDPSAWPRQKLPLMVGNMYRPGKMHGDLEMQQLLVRAACFRTTFQVPDPTRGRYSLRLSYRGGIRAFINGRELCRRHLPPGELGPEARGEPYPAEAYVCREDESNESQRNRLIRRTGGEYVEFCPDLVGRFEDGFVDVPEGQRADRQYWQGMVNRRGWDRVTKLRNRVVGPVVIPEGFLRTGTNVLAVEVRAADLHPVVAGGKGTDWGRSYVMGANYTWSHCRLLELTLRCSAEVPSVTDRPKGVQVWVEDVHRRLYSRDFGPPGRGAAGRTVRFVGAVNGTYGAQLAVVADRELTNLKATPSELKSADGSALAASAVRTSYLVGHSVDQMVSLGQWRGLPEVLRDPLCPPAEMALLRHGPAEAKGKRLPRAERLREIQKLKFFDHIGAAPKRVPAGMCQPIWLSLRIPPDARGGTYRGTVRISADGMEAATVPMVAEVFDWHVPDPTHFQSYFAGEQSAYGVARRYKVPLWSDAHFRLMEPSFRQLARLGASWVFIPVIQTTEFGNLGDSMIRWTRKADGGLAFDFSRLDRYLDLAAKGRPAGAKETVVCFVVAHGTDAGDKATVDVMDAGTGKAEALDLSRSSPHYRDAWQAFSSAVYEHMKSRGMEDALYWGFGWDGIGDADLIPLLAEFVPEAVRWARGSHAHNRAPGGWAQAFSAYSCIYGVPITEDSRAGWRARDLFLLNPRAGCSVASANGHSPPFAYRLLMDRAIVAGCRGLARMGADYWDGVFYQGYSGRAWPGALPGIGCLALLWPGDGGGETSQRLEVLLEGIQEAEARIFLEQALRRRLLPADLAGRVEDVLRRHHRECLYMPVGRIGVQIQEYCAGWQDRSRRLYQTAEEVGRLVKLDVGRTEIAMSLPARSSVPVHLTLRNWTSRSRAWKMASDKPWLVPVANGGSLSGHQTLEVRADSGSLAPGESAEAVLTVTDVASGKAHRVKVTADVGPIFELAVGKAYDFLGSPGHASSWGAKHVGDFATFNVPAGGAESRQFVFINHSGSDIDFQIASPVAWLTVEPAAGRLRARGRAKVKLTAAPVDRAAARHEVLVSVREPNGQTRREAKVVVHVIPPYRPPMTPTGRPVYLSELPKSMVKRHKSRAYWYGTSDRRRPDYGPKFDENRNLIGGTPQLTVYDIVGKGYAAFSAKVKVSAGRRRVRESASGKKVSFEIYVDGQLRAQSGVMTAADPPRLLVADGLAGAKHVRLYARWDRPEAKYLGGTVGIAWCEPSFHLAK